MGWQRSRQSLCCSSTAGVNNAPSNQPHQHAGEASATSQQLVLLQYPQTASGKPHPSPAEANRLRSHTVPQTLSLNSLVLVTATRGKRPLASRKSHEKQVPCTGHWQDNNPITICKTKRLPWHPGNAHLVSSKPGASKATAGPRSQCHLALADLLGSPGEQI